QEHRRVVHGGHERGRGHDPMAPLLEEGEEGAPDLVDLHGAESRNRRATGELGSPVAPCHASDPRQRITDAVPVVAATKDRALTLNFTRWPFFRPFRWMVTNPLPLFFRALTEAWATELAEA